MTNTQTATTVVAIGLLIVLLALLLHVSLERFAARRRRPVLAERVADEVYQRYVAESQNAQHRDIGPVTRKSWVLFAVVVLVVWLVLDVLPAEQIGLFDAVVALCYRALVLGVIALGVISLLRLTGELYARIGLLTLPADQRAEARARWEENNKERGSL